MPRIKVQQPGDAFTNLPKDLMDLIFSMGIRGDKDAIRALFCTSHWCLEQFWDRLASVSVRVDTSNQNGAALLRRLNTLRRVLKRQQSTEALARGLTTSYPPPPDLLTIDGSAARPVTALFDFHIAAMQWVQCRLQLKALSVQGSLRGEDTLPHLRDLTLYKCTWPKGESMLALPARIQQLRLQGCNLLKSIVIQHRTWLTQLTADSCSKLSSISLVDCQQLQHVEAICCQRLQMVDTTGCMGLRYLSMKQCGQLKGWQSTEGGLSQAPSTVVQLVFARCRQLITIPSLSACKGLRGLSFNNCNSLAIIPSLSSCSNLQRLYVEKCDLVARFPPLTSCTHLQDLRLYGLTALEEVPQLSQCQHLTQLLFKDCSTITHVPDLSQLTELRDLGIDSCPKLRGAIPGLTQCTALKKLSIRQLSPQQLQVPADLSRLKNLQLLLVWSSNGAAPAAPAIGGCTQLKSLVLFGLSTLPTLQQLSQLTRLQIGLTDEVHALPELSQCTKLHELLVISLPGCMLRSLPSLDACWVLQTLRLIACERLEQLPQLGNCVQLRRLYVSGCHRLQSLADDLAQCRQLYILEVRDCSQLQHICPAITISKGQPGSLLKISNCPLLRALPDLTACSGLRRIQLECCRSLRAFPDLSACVNLQQLRVRECRALRSFPSVSGLPSLRQLHVSCCSKFKTTPAIRNCGSLQRVLFDQCPALGEVSIELCGGQMSLTISQCGALTQLQVHNCSRLQSISLRHCGHVSVVSIGQCGQLQGVHTSCCTIGDLQVSGCHSLKPVVIPSTVKIAREQFDDCNVGCCLQSRYRKFQRLIRTLRQ